MAVRTFRILDFSGGLQTATSRIIKKQNELVGSKNAEYKSIIGGVTRRLGYTQLYSTLRLNKSALGAFVHRWSTGSRTFMASNNVGDTATVLSYWDGAAWQNAAPVIAANTKMQAMNHLGEAYVFGASSSTYMDPLNIDSSLSFSTTRNLYAAPRAKFIAEFGGALFAINTQVNLPGGWTTYADRAYKSSAPLGAITFVKGDQTLQTGAIKVDSARYIKTGQALDIYTGRTDTRVVANLIVASVDKLNNSFTVNPLLTYASGDVVAANDTIAVASGNTSITQGQPVLLTSGGAPGGLTTGTVYYVIRSTPTATTIKLASNPANAQAGTAIDITSTGTGGTLNLALTALNRDEIWGAGRKGTLSVYWNTDYPTTENAEFLRIPQGKDDAPEFTGWAKTTARLFLFTRNSFYKYDGQNFSPVSTTVGALSHESIQVIGSWVIFPHYSGIWAYNDSTGQLQLISRGIKDWIKAVPYSNWATASAGVVDNIYKLQVGTVASYKGETLSGTLRFTYDFDSNVWSTEFHTRKHIFQFLGTYNDQIKLIFADDTGKLYVDEEGNSDDGITIPFEIETGRHNFTIDEKKNYLSCWIYTESPRGGNVSYRLDGGDWKELGELRSDAQRFRFPEEAKGNDISFKVTQNDDGDPISVIQIVVNFNSEQGAYD